MYRDEWGTPHVFAQNFRALAFAFGYAQAEDHLAEMLVAYRIANGRASEIFGENYVPSDEFALKMGHAKLAQRALAEAGAVTRDLCEGFALGVNSWLVENRAAAPPWAEGMSPADVLALMHSYLMSFAPFDIPGTYAPPPGTPSANAWAIGPERSQNGRAMLVINPHADYDGPFRWYEAHLVTPDMNVAGATLFGVPMILQGHNGELGWALSPNYPDYADIYVDPAPKLEIKKDVVRRYGEDVLRAAITLQQFEDMTPYYVRTANGMESRGVQAMFTTRGPVMDMTGGRYLTYQIGGYWNLGALRQLVDMARAQNLAEFQDALAMRQLPSFHILYADRPGNIFYLYNTSVGDRAPRHAVESFTPGAAPDYDWTTPVDGTNPAREWGPMLAVSSLPSVENPPSGYIQACGAAPWTVTEQSGLDPNRWPDWLARDTDTTRAERVRHLLSLGKRSLHDCQSMLYDMFVPAAELTVPVLLTAAEENPAFVQRAHPDLVIALDVLREWNFVADPKSEAMGFFHTWWSVLKNFAPERLQSDEQLLAAIAENTPAVRQFALQAASEAATLLRNAFQTAPVRWGDVHFIQRGQRVEPIGGAMTGGPVFVASDDHYEDGGWPATYGYDFAMVVEFGDRPRAVSMVPFGASENPDSPHYDDQLDLMLERRFKVTRFEPADVARHATSAKGRQLSLLPRGATGRIMIEALAPVEARLESTVQPPGILPEGFAAYTVFVAAETAPRDGELLLELQLRVPDGVCHDNALRALALYAYSPDYGWYALDEQTLDAGRRTFIARDLTAQTYAVLGPEVYRAGDPSISGGFNVARETGFIPRPPRTNSDESVSGLLAKLDKNLPEPQATGTGFGASNEETAEDPNRKFEFTPMSPLPKTKAVKKGRKYSAGPTGRRQFIFQKIEGEDTEPETTMEELPPSGSEFAEVDPPSEPETPKVQPSRSESKAIIEEPSFSEQEDQNVEPPSDPTESRSPQETAKAPPTPEPTARNETAPQPAPQQIAARDASSTADPLGLQRRLDRTKSTPRYFGRELEFRPPGTGAVFRLMAPQRIRAGMDRLDAPPAPFPDGLVPFTPILSIAHMPRGIPGTTVMTIPLPKGVCRPEHHGALAVYVYDSEDGWRELPGAKFKPASRTFTGLDDAFRTYVVLGPAEYRLKHPNTAQQGSNE